MVAAIASEEPVASIFIGEFFCLEVGGSGILRNGGTHLDNYMKSLRGQLLSHLCGL
jgi:hypothetical protein